MEMKTMAQMIGGNILSGLGAAPLDVLVEISVCPDEPFSVFLLTIRLIDL
jgi:hypothetical protein